MSAEHGSNEHKVDRTRWNPGPWDTEPDKLNWTTGAGLPGTVVRNGLGALCGYVAVPPSHPWHGRGYNEGEWPDTPAHQIDVHGGLTYADGCAGHICHVPNPGEPDNVWWFGFDCGHSGDLIPGIPHCTYGTYRSLDYVRSEVEHLAQQLAARAP